MGTSHSFGELADKFGKLAEEMPQVAKKGTTAAAKAAKEVFVTFIGVATGGDMVLNNVGKGARLGVTYKVTGEGATAKARVRPTGPIHLVEYRINPHLITSKRAGGSRRSRFRRFSEGTAGEGIGGGRRAMLRTPYGPRPFVIHPGIKFPLKPWTRAVPVVKEVTPVVYEKETTAALAKVFS